MPVPARLEMRPLRLQRVHFDEVIVFRDNAHNSGRLSRAEDFRRRVIATQVIRRHPGVLLLRGAGGDQRRLVNERALAEWLAARHGFRIVDPATATVDEIVDAVGGADVVAGVEGSHLVHGLMLMPRDATLLVIQPPHRVVSVLKMLTDLKGQTYAFVVGDGPNHCFQRRHRGSRSNGRAWLARALLYRPVTLMRR